MVKNLKKDFSIHLFLIKFSKKNKIISDTENENA